MFKKISTLVLGALLFGATPAQAFIKGHMSWGDALLLGGAVAKIYKGQLGATKGTLGSLAPDIAMFIAFNYKQSHEDSLTSAVKGLRPTKGITRSYIMDSMEKAMGIMSAVVLINSVYNLYQERTTGGSALSK